MIQGIITAILLAAFVGGWIWLWGANRKPALDAAARIPLEDEPATEMKYNAEGQS